MEYKNDKTANRRRYKSRYHSPHNYKTKRSKAENRAAILVGVATFIVLASLVLVFTFGDSIYGFLDRTFHPSSDGKSSLQGATLGVSTEAASTAPTTPPIGLPIVTTPSETPTEAVAQSADFERLAKAAGLEPAKLTGSQMIFVETSGTDATVYTYEKDSKGKWNQKFSPAAGFTGEGGVSVNTAPYDAVTPKGVFNIEFAMGTNPNPGTALSYHEIYYGLRWVTDPASVNYNRLIEEDESNIDYETSQDLSEYTLSYPYCVIFDYNRNPVDPSKGCSKFLHVGSQPNNRGGVGISEDALREILVWLNPANSPQIAIF